MTSVTIQLTDEMRRFLELQQGIIGASDPAETVQKLIEVAMLEARPESLEALLLEGLNSGPVGEWDFEGMRAAVRREEARLRDLEGGA